MKKVIYIIILILIYSCKDDPPIVPLDPCASATKVKAEFNTIRDHGDVLDYSDTIFPYKTIKFEGQGNYQEYRWLFQDEDYERIGKEIYLKFQKAYGPIQVRLIAKDTNKIYCFQNYDGIDTLYKYIVVNNYWTGAIVGKYLVAPVNNPNDTFEVNIRWKHLEAESYELRMDNLNKGCLDTFKIEYYTASFSNNVIDFNTLGPLVADKYKTCTLKSNGKIILNKNWVDIVIEYDSEVENKNHHFIFIGKRR